MCKTRVEFEGEVGIDSGGLSQEWYLLLSRELLKPSYCLFVKQRGETYHIDPRSKLNDEHVAYFRFTGQILAKAILDRKIVGMHLSRALLKVGHGVLGAYYRVETSKILKLTRAITHTLLHTAPRLSSANHWPLQTSRAQTRSTTRASSGCFATTLPTLSRRHFLSPSRSLARPRLLVSSKMVISCAGRSVAMNACTRTFLARDEAQRWACAPAVVWFSGYAMLCDAMRCDAMRCYTAQ